MIAASHPILSCDEARELEARRLGGDEAKEWAAMQQAGRAIAEAALRDFEEIGGFRANGRVLVLVGKGHNGGDALIAATEVLRRFPEATADIVFVFGERSMRPLAQRAWREALDLERVEVRSAERLARNYELCLDGIFGFQFRPPAEERVKSLLAQANALAVRLRAAVDLPSAGLFRADFTYATGSVKRPVIESEMAGRVRYLDLGFFSGEAQGGNERVLTPAVLGRLAGWREARSDKRSFRHVFVLAGSRNYPGAAMMTVQAALKAGAGLVTAFVPESVAAAFAAHVPEAIWVAWPETPDGGLALEGERLLHERIERADALVIGPGIGRERETMALVKGIVSSVTVPVVLDADALQLEIVRAAKSPCIVTPHAGEFQRIAAGKTLGECAAETGAVVVLKGPVTRVANEATVYHSVYGGPVLARGGSGDLLAGMIGTMLAQNASDPVLAAARGVVWHGLAAEALARRRGQVAVRTTEVLEELGTVLREEAGNTE